jgi:hypothetical protein
MLPAWTRCNGMSTSVNLAVITCHSVSFTRSCVYAVSLECLRRGYTSLTQPPSCVTPNLVSRSLCHPPALQSTRCGHSCPSFCTTSSDVRPTFSFYSSHVFRSVCYPHPHPTHHLSDSLHLHSHALLPRFTSRTYAPTHTHATHVRSCSRPPHAPAHSHVLELSRTHTDACSKSQACRPLVGGLQSGLCLLCFPQRR